MLTSLFSSSGIVAKNAANIMVSKVSIMAIVNGEGRNLRNKVSIALVSFKYVAYREEQNQYFQLAPRLNFKKEGRRIPLHSSRLQVQTLP